jgi:hypothetical protein
MGVQIPPVLVLIVCKTVLAGAPDPNASFTHWENLKWDTPNSMMVCRRNEIQLYDPVEEIKLNLADDPALPLNPNFANATQCARAGITLAAEWDEAHRNTSWRVWRLGCPAAIVDLSTGALIGYKLPECGHRDTVVCETDSVI